MPADWNSVTNSVRTEPTGITLITISGPRPASSGLPVAEPMDMRSDCSPMSAMYCCAVSAVCVESRFMPTVLA